MDVAGAPIGLLGGSFDPIHHGHLQLASDALLHLPLDHVRFMPAAQPWQKGALGAGAVHRATMVQLAIADKPRFALDMREIDRGGTTYTVDTVRALRTALPSQPLVLIMGSDQFARFETWKDWQEIVRLAHLAVAQRQGASITKHLSARPASIASRHAGSIVEFAMTPVDVSATEVRRLLRGPISVSAEQRLAAMVPGVVLDYIRSNSLYKE